MLKQPHVSQTTSKYPSKMCMVLVILEKQCQNNLLGSFYDLECRERKMTVTMAIEKSTFYSITLTLPNKVF